jgi:putative ABC transport system ATP-binding protein
MLWFRRGRGYLRSSPGEMDSRDLRTRALTVPGAIAAVHPVVCTFHRDERAICMNHPYLSVEQCCGKARGMNRSEPIVSVEDASRRFPLDHRDVTALDHASLAVYMGEFLAIAGPSGSGKSTLLNLIGCIDKPTSGRIRIEGVDTGALSPARVTDLRRRKIGFVFQTFNLIPVFTAAENVEYPLLLQGLSRGERRQRVAEALKSVSLEDRAYHRPDLLSGGERQRVAVARAIVHRPALVLADEPTANLDSHNATQLIDLMRDLNRSLGVTFIFSTHDQRLLEHTPRIVRLTDGHVESDSATQGDGHGQVLAASVS